MNRIAHNLTRLLNRALLSVDFPNTPGTTPAGRPVSPKVVYRACCHGEFGSARLNFLQLAEKSQILVLRSLDDHTARRLTRGLPESTLARLNRHMPAQAKSRQPQP
ncbi:MAG: hypothetical protein EA372_11180 [Chromatiaceae bacterium]|nr:MAG: hypothetical protein EA372_11180 [Chromatiaceae bacterium]